ncbi:MAG: 50S ribosomal protein L4 [Candidatus Jacksonbacteria bacterium RIFOXYC2_FULL_44_29]|nr:MAG: 50S ribosomal protein L4 [Parcubacteria group bacterium GW2011_GWA2_42_28]KKT56207.1 MAG: 50S ribosomal protein L4 [Parcubacteria group bacterium GW2011_GWC2_44_22]OGY76142.1 MAG: 50S ribosomal protein L4 [Candidatus Jacksonbacteria bacterium RIFOXYA2_FULL_43_12]OGY77732.1 MAG: 50S ribosomal protein L4 [Candidatus Jacksonbacteria bacterium RIFOXYB2_FULL_44_15]OGY78869.1 MAG: 50S ribosomal protein L4 [Candidatus Jacksonbacteria bacterium RIFOXYD2_FULL_43_21]OGY80208.1 MAG: 50S ribosomal
MNLPIYNIEGHETGKISLNPKIFGVKTKSWILHQVIVAQQANSRVNVAHTKTRGEVRGGGKKPWKQKGTGRARHGSIRSPLWRGGGITFGPLNTRNFKIKVNQKVKTQALMMALSEKVNEKALIILEQLSFDVIKTKNIVDLFKNLKINDKKILLSLPVKDDKIVKSARQIKKIKLTAADSLNVRELLWADTLLTTVKGVERIEKTHAANTGATQKN